jgi:hypothetical protein
MEPTSLLRKNNKIRRQNTSPLNAKLIFFAGFKGVPTKAGEKIFAAKNRLPIRAGNSHRWTHFRSPITADAEAPLTATPRGKRSGHASSSMRGTEGRGAA